MASTLTDLDMNVCQAFRTAFGAVQKATTGAVATIAATVDGYTRASGSFLADGFDIGDEVVASGFPLATNNGLGWVIYVDALRMDVARPDGVVMVAAAAGPTVTITAGMPALHILEDWKKSPVLDRPWTRESYQPVVITPASLRAPTAKVRLVGVFWLHVFYPADTGTSGAKRLRGKILASIYPAMDLQANGQVVRVQQAAPKPHGQDDAWISAPIAWHFQADTINPA